MTPKRLATPFAVVYLVHCRRVRRRDLLANSERLPTLFNENHEHITNRSRDRDCRDAWCGVR
ncbi:MAG: hypothetical protein LBK82_17745 [Planctomycetaceae bacterium]|nr:hypothetical protein [Planctomycetaceae bacterium]